MFEILDMLNNDIILVLTKRDLIAKDIYEEKLLTYFDYKFIDKKSNISFAKWLVKTINY